MHADAVILILCPHTIISECLPPTINQTLKKIYIIHIYFCFFYLVKTVLYPHVIPNENGIAFDLVICEQAAGPALVHSSETPSHGEGGFFKSVVNRIRCMIFV